MKLSTLTRSRLRLWMFSQEALLIRQFLWTIRTPDGRLVNGSVDIQAPAGVPVVQERFVPVVEGDLVYAGFSQFNDGSDPGLVYCEIRLFTDSMRDEDSGYIVCAGWPSVGMSPCWPVRPFWPADGLGSPMTMIPIADPAAGVAASLTLLGFELTQLWAARWTHTCDATVANRRPRLQVEITTGVFLDWLSGGDFVASATGRATMGATVGQENGISNIRCAPGTMTNLPSGSVVSCTSISLQAGDQISGARLFGRWQIAEI